MRVIKFRAWDSREKKMDYDPFCWPTSIDLKDSYNNLNTLIAGQFGKVHHGGPVGEDNTHMRYLMQYTGLKDKNGEEIYEGDILKGYVKEIKRYVVSFNNGSYELHHEFARWGLLSRMFEINMKDMPVKIIGNIHENPELL